MRSDSTHESSITPSDPDSIDPETVQQELRARTEEIKRRELRQAFTQLEACGTLTTEQRQIIGQMAVTIVDGILTAPESMLEDASEHNPETVQTAVELFVPDREKAR